jgi:hypothetical protein
VFMFARLAASSVSIAAKGSGTGAEGRRGDEHLAIVVDDVVDDQADQAGVLRYSDDHHIVRELGEPPPPDRAATHPAQWPGRARYPRVSTRDPARRPLTRPGPAPLDRPSPWRAGRSRISFPSRPD